MDEQSVTITAYQDGPYLIRGPFRMLDQEGQPIVLQRRTVALCRCGKSRLRPLCDGTHRAIGFRAPGGAESQASSERAQSSQTVDLASGCTAGEDEQRRRAQRPPTIGSGSQCGHRVELLELVREAERCVNQALEEPCMATDYSAMSLAEPLLTAARRLLEWGVPTERQTVPRGGSDGHRRARLGRSGSAELLTRALASAQRLESPADPRLHQVQSLLTDAKRALAT